MKILGITLEIGSTKHDFNSSLAVEKYGSIEALFEKLQTIQNTQMTSGFHSIRLVVPKGKTEQVIRLQTDRKVTKAEATEFLCSREIPVS